MLRGLCWRLMITGVVCCWRGWFGVVCFASVCVLLVVVGCLLVVVCCCLLCLLCVGLLCAFVVGRCIRRLCCVAY